jgi:hypothetical protein
MNTSGTRRSGHYRSLCNISAHLESSILSPSDQGRPEGWHGQENDPTGSSRGKCDDDFMLFCQEIEIDEIVKHCFLVLFVWFADSERIAGFVICLIWFKFQVGGGYLANIIANHSWKSLKS